MLESAFCRTAWVGATAVLLLSWSSAGTAAQTNTGEISGVVRDSQGGVLPGTAVVAEHVDSGTRVERVTDEQGRYFLSSLRVGTYLLTAELTGFRRVLRSGVIVQLGQMLALDFTLEVGGLTEEIRVTGDVPLLQATNAEISDVIENRQVVQIPLNVVNQDNFDLPNRIFGTPNFGRVFSAKSPREMQFGAKLSF